jgi:TRAP-type uncharacterized transport system fused permease subunit
MRWGVITPIYTVGLVMILLVLNWFLKRARRRGDPEYTFGSGWRQARQVITAGLADTAGLANFGMAIFLALSFILVGLYKTGVAQSLTTEIVKLGAGNLHLILLFSALYSILMGMVGLQRVAYLFLAVTMVPAVTGMTDINPIALHLFLIFYAGLGGITMPVAVYSYIAATIAGADQRRTGLTAMRLGIVLAIVPWFFVYQPALLIVGSKPWPVIYTLVLMTVGLWLFTSGLEGYLIRVGILKPWERVPIVIGGFLLAFPEWITTGVGFAICAVSIAFALFRKWKWKQPTELA